MPSNCDMLWARSGMLPVAGPRMQRDVLSSQLVLQRASSHPIICHLGLSYANDAAQHAAQYFPPPISGLLLLLLPLLL